MPHSSLLLKKCAHKKWIGAIHSAPLKSRANLTFLNAPKVKLYHFTLGVHSFNKGGNFYIAAALSDRDVTFMFILVLIVLPTLSSNDQCFYQPL